MLKLGFGKVKKKPQVHSLREPMRMTGTRLYYIPKIWCDVKVTSILESFPTRKLFIDQSNLLSSRRMENASKSFYTFYAHEH